MTYKEKLIDLLKSDEQVKEAMEKLEFGCKIRYDKDEYIFLSYTDNSLDTLRLLNNDLGIEEIEEKYFFEIIGLPLSERFIRMYCDNYLIDNKMVNCFLFIEGKKIIIDDKFDLDNQDDEVYQKIYEALLELNK